MDTDVGYGDTVEDSLTWSRPTHPIPAVRLPQPGEGHAASTGHLPFHILPYMSKCILNPGPM